MNKLKDELNVLKKELRLEENNLKNNQEYKDIKIKLKTIDKEQEQLQKQEIEITYGIKSKYLDISKENVYERVNYSRGSAYRSPTIETNINESVLKFIKKRFKITNLTKLQIEEFVDKIIEKDMNENQTLTEIDDKKDKLDELEDNLENREREIKKKKEDIENKIRVVENKIYDYKKRLETSKEDKIKQKEKMSKWTKIEKARKEITKEYLDEKQKDILVEAI